MKKINLSRLAADWTTLETDEDFADFAIENMQALADRIRELEGNPKIKFHNEIQLDVGTETIKTGLQVLFDDFYSPKTSWSIGQATV